jgi:hypothetical protein
MYIPLLIQSEVAREAIRCYHHSLEGSTRRNLPMFFAVGARRSFSSRIIFTHSERHGRKGIHWWARLRRENHTHHDLLLFDVLDMDDTDRLVSAMMMKNHLSFLHAVVHFRFHYFVRASDDVFFSFRHMYAGMSQAVKENRAMSTETVTELAAGKFATEQAIHNGVKIARWRVANGHYVRKLLRSRHLWAETLPGNNIELSRNRNPLLSTAYLLGGAWFVSSDIAAFLVGSSLDLPPFYWFEEDTNVGRLMAPFVTAFDNYYSHNFFNATPFVNRAFRGTVPRAFSYCRNQSWFIHKYAWGALRWVDRTSMVMYCTEKDFGDRKAHPCASKLLNISGLPPRRFFGRESKYIEPHPQDRMAWRQRGRRLLSCNWAAMKSIVSMHNTKEFLYPPFRNQM